MLPQFSSRWCILAVMVMYVTLFQVTLLLKWRLLKKVLSGDDCEKKKCFFYYWKLCVLWCFCVLCICRSLHGIKRNIPCINIVTTIFLLILFTAYFRTNPYSLFMPLYQFHCGVYSHNLTNLGISDEVKVSCWFSQGGDTSLIPKQFWI